MKTIKITLITMCIAASAMAQNLKVGTDFKLTLPLNSKVLSLEEFKNFFGNGITTNNLPFTKNNFIEIHKWQSFSAGNILIQIWEVKRPYRKTTLEQQQQQFRGAFRKNYKDSKIINTAFSKFLIYDSFTGDIIRSAIYSSPVNDVTLSVAFEYKAKDEALAKTYQAALINTIGLQ